MTVGGKRDYDFVRHTYIIVVGSTQRNAKTVKGECVCGDACLRRLCVCAVVRDRVRWCVPVCDGA